LRTREPAYDWRITVRVHGRLLSLHFAGARTHDGFIVAASASRNGLAEVNELLMQIGNERANALRKRMRSGLESCALGARMWSSLKAQSNAEPRWPEVPKATCCSGTEASGRRV